jgi:hypothetical protein
MRAIQVALLFALVICGAVPGRAAAAPGTKSDWPANHPLDSLQPGTWFMATNSQMIAVAPDPVPEGVTGVRSVMNSWSGGAYDTVRDRLIVFGGGHNNYGGNEVYAFDVKSLKWLRLTDPSKVEVTESRCYYSDGNPQASHTYNTVFYVPPPVDRIFTVNCGDYAPACRVAQNKGVTLETTAPLFCLNLDTCKWERRPSQRFSRSCQIGGMSAVDASNGHVWFHATETDHRLFEYDPRTDATVVRSEPDIRYDYNLTMDMDPQRRILLMVGGGHAPYLYHVATNALVNGMTSLTNLVTTGDTEIEKMQDVGLAFHPPSKMFAAWSGGADVYLLDVEKKVWKKSPLAATNQTIPGPPNYNGTFGRFRYIPSKDVFIVVSQVDQNVFFFRPAKKKD